MDDRRLGRTARAIRTRLGLRQADVAAKAGVSQRAVAGLELGRVESMTLRTIRSIGRAIDATLPLDIRWSGGDVYRLLDEAHAELVEHVVRLLRAEGWHVLVEHTFNYFGERGSVDIVGWHEATRTLLLVEVKSRLVDLQDLFASFGRKLRIVPQALADREGWRPADVARVIVVLGSTSNRAIVERHAATFDATLPQRSVDFLRWARSPTGPMSALWFVSPQTLAGRRRPHGRTRPAAR